MCKRKRTRALLENTAVVQARLGNKQIDLSLHHLLPLMDLMLGDASQIAATGGKKTRAMDGEKGSRKR